MGNSRANRCVRIFKSALTMPFLILASCVRVTSKCVLLMLVCPHRRLTRVEQRLVGHTDRMRVGKWNYWVRREGKFTRVCLDPVNPYD